MQEDDPRERTGGWIGELRRRTVFRVAAAYVVVAWVLMQGAEIVFPAFELSNSALRMLILVLAAGLPIAVILAWLLDVTPSGVRLSQRIRSSTRIGQAPGQAGPDAEAQPAGHTIEIIALGACIPALAFLIVLLAANPMDPTEESELRAPGESMSQPRFAAPEGDSLAVMPFEDLSGEAETRSVFARGVHEDLLTELARQQGLHVVSRATVLAYVDQPGGLQTMVRELGVQHVLQGSVRRGPELIRVSAQLTETSSGRLIWADSFEAEPADVLRVQLDLAGRISEALRGELQLAAAGDPGAGLDAPATNRPRPGTPGARHPQAASATPGPGGAPRVVPSAYDAFLEARELHHQLDAENREDLARTRMLYETAVRLDPSLAQAWAQLGILHAEAHWFGIDRSENRCQEARQAIERARELGTAPDRVLLAEGIDAYYCQADYEKAVALFGQAIDAVPGDSRAIFYRAMVLRRLGRLEEALAEQRRALTLDPLNLGDRDELPLTLAFLGRLDEARHETEVLLSLDPTRIRARFYGWHLGLELDGQPEAVLAQILATPQSQFGFQHYGLLERVAVLAGQPETAIEVIAAAPTGHPDPGFRDFRLARLEGWAGHAAERARLLAEARRKYEAVVEEFGASLAASDRHRSEAMLAAAEGDLDRAIELQRKNVEANPIERDLVTGSPPLALLLHYHLMAGDVDEAHAILRRIERAGAFGAVLFHGWYHLLNWPEYTPALQNARFRAKLEKMLPPYVQRWLSVAGGGVQIPIAS